jgi:hypothetical protein
LRCQLLSPEKQGPLLEFFSDLVAVFLFKGVLKFFSKDERQQMLIIFIIGGLHFYLEDGFVIGILDDKLKGRIDLKHPTLIEILHSVIII